MIKEERWTDNVGPFNYSLRAGSPRAEMRACNNHGGKSINAHLISIYIIYKPNQSYSSGSLGENLSYKAQSKNVNNALFSHGHYTCSGNSKKKQQGATTKTGV